MTFLSSHVIDSNIVPFFPQLNADMPFPVAVFMFLLKILNEKYVINLPLTISAYIFVLTVCPRYSSYLLGLLKP